MAEKKIGLTKKQNMFRLATADEVLFGGAAGGGKSYGQLVDALLYALKYPESRQLILRRTFADLERSLIGEHFKMFPPAPGYVYNASKHKGRFENGSEIEFGYCDNENDVYRYQGAEYDTIRFDELTHFTEFQYTYLMSRLRGVNDYPKQIKSSTNPGGVGHAWVKARFIDPAPPGEEFVAEKNVDLLGNTVEFTRIFIPSKISDNKYLVENDPTYAIRLQNLNPDNRKALLEGIWELNEGQYFPEFNRNDHVIEPFEIPKNWKRYYTMDYGMDMYAAFLIAVDEVGNCFVYKEIYQKDLIVSASIEKAKEVFSEMFEGEGYTYLAPPDLWNRRQETGKSVADYWYDAGIPLTKSNNERVPGWRSVKEFLRLQKNEFGEMKPKLRIFPCCVNLIRTLPELQHDDKNYEDVADKPHELTHAPDALRGFCIYWISPAETAKKRRKWSEDMFEDYYNARNDAERAYLVSKWGEPE